MSQNKLFSLILGQFPVKEPTVMRTRENIQCGIARPPLHCTGALHCILIYRQVGKQIPQSGDFCLGHQKFWKSSVTGQRNKLLSIPQCYLSTLAIFDLTKIAILQLASFGNLFAIWTPLSNIYFLCLVFLFSWSFVRSMVLLNEL